MQMEIKETESSEILELFVVWKGFFQVGKTSDMKGKMDREQPHEDKKKAMWLTTVGWGGHKEETDKPTEPIKTDKPNSG